MYLETWMIASFFILLAYAVSRSYQSGMRRGLEISTDICIKSLENEGLIATELDSKGELIIKRALPTREELDIIFSELEKRGDDNDSIR